MERDFLWRAELACRAAWPAERETSLGGWVARQSGGTIRRVNSLNQLPDCAALDDELIDRAEAYYGRFGQPALVRLMSFASESAQALVRRGYRPEGGTKTLHAAIAGTASTLDADVAVSDDPERGWLAARCRIAGSDPKAFHAMLDLIEGPKLFSAALADGVMHSVAYGVLHDGLLVIEAVATDEAQRGRGLARKTVAALLGWAVSQGVDDAVLQVVTDNAPARALYRSLGFSTELFDYWYMRQAEA